MMRSALSNSAGFERWVMSPVWIMKAGFCGSPLILPIASSSVPMALGLAGLSKPTWLSLICRKLSLPASAASAPSMIPSERGTPPAIVQSTPVPAQVMHSNILRRLGPAFGSSLVEWVMVVLRALVGLDAVETGGRRGLFPGGAGSDEGSDHEVVMIGSSGR